MDSELHDLIATDGVIELYTLIIDRWRTKFNIGCFHNFLTCILPLHIIHIFTDFIHSATGAPIVDVGMKVLYISRIGLSESDLDMYMEYMIGNTFEHVEWYLFHIFKCLHTHT